VKGGREQRPIGAYELAKAVEELGVGEILLNCIDCDGKVPIFFLPCEPPEF
jgi:glutamine amidotransferase/cyclase